MALPDTETEPPGLLSMPAEILDMIMEHFDLETIQILRKVCHHIRSHIDNFPQDPYLTHITIFQSRKRPNLARDGYISVMYTSLKNQNIEVEYQKNGKNGCRILFENREKTIENQEFASVLGNDLGLILRNQNLEMTRIRFVFPPNPKSRLSENCLETFHGRFLAALTPHLESRRTLIPTEKIHILGINQESQIMKILQFLDPSSLELILIRFDKQRGFSSPTMKIDGLIGLDQWKQAKSISIHGLNLASGIENFSHLERSAIELKQISVDELMVLRETVLLRLPFLDKFIIYYRHLKDQKQFLPSFGEPFSVDDRKYSTWWYSAPNNNENALQITWNPKFKSFIFEGTKKEYVPNGALE